MANRSHPITPVPVNLKAVAGLALVDGTSYLIQNRGNDPIFLAAVAAAPDPETEEISYQVDPLAPWVIEVGTDPAWAWTLRGTSSLRVNESPGQ